MVAIRITRTGIYPDCTKRKKYIDENELVRTTFFIPGLDKAGVASKYDVSFSRFGTNTDIKDVWGRGT
jgi:hypothetical protein